MESSTWVVLIFFILICMIIMYGFIYLRMAGYNYSGYGKGRV